MSAMRTGVAVLLLAATVVLGATAARGDEVELVSGEVLKNVAVERADGRVRFSHPILGWVDVAASQVRSVRPDGSAAAEAAAATAAAVAAAAPAPEAKPEPKPPAWKYKAELGLNGTSGNTDNQDLRAAVSALLEEPEHRWKFEAAYSTSETENVTTKSQFFATGLKDWMWTDSRWFVFAAARYDRDRFQEWDERVSVGAGPGYKLIDQEDLKLRLRAGLAELREFGGEDGDWRLEGLLGADGTWKISESQSLEAHVVYFPDLDDGGEYRVVGSAAWSIKLSSKDSLALKLGVEDEYDTHRDDPFDKNDFKYFAVIQYEF